MAQLHKAWDGVSRTTVVAALVMLAVFGCLPVTDDAARQWRELNDRGKNAYLAGDYVLSVELAGEALQVAEQTFGPRHPKTLISLNKLAALYQVQDRYGEAELLMKEVLQASREELGSSDPGTIQSLNELLMKEVLQASREELGSSDPGTIQSLNELGLFYQDKGRYGEAEPLLKEALQGNSQVLGPHHRQTLKSLNYLAGLYRDEGRYTEAELLLKEVLQARREGLGTRHSDTTQSLNNLGLLYRDEGGYGEAEQLLKEALQGNREVLGPHHRQTMINLNNLAVLYQAQGRYAEAEPLLKEVLQARREGLGHRHSDTLISLNNLAVLYQAQGRYAEAEPLFKEALQGNREVRGFRHPQTLLSANNLAGLYQAQGRYGEAEDLLRESPQANPDMLGTRHPDTVFRLNNLAELYRAQGRYGEAEPLYREALQRDQETLGPGHPNTLLSLNNVGLLYWAQGRYGEAEPLFKEVLKVSRESLGQRHPYTLTTLNNLALLYWAQGRYGEAEPLYREALQGDQETLGHGHPSTLLSLNNLALLYWAQGRYGEAEPLYREALQGNSKVFGPRHPYTLGTQINMVVLLVNQRRPQEAVRTLQEMEPNLLGRIGQELYSTEGGAVRRQLVASQATFQDVVLTLATTEASSDARRLAGTVMLRWKGLQGEEEAYLARLARRSQDPRVRALAGEVGDLRSGLAAAARGGEPKAFETALQALEAKQLALGQVSRDYKDHLRVRTANLDELRAALPTDAVLIEFRQFRPFDFHSGTLGEQRVAALLLAGFDEPVVIDLGSLAELREAAKTLLAQSSAAEEDKAAGALYQRLFAPFESTLAAAKVVYLAPDGFLQLVPFARLKLADGRFWEERQELRLLPSGRDLLRGEPDKPARGLLALGGIDFSAAMIAAGKPDSVFLVAAGDEAIAGGVTRTAATLGSFLPLPASWDEASEVKDWYQRLRKGEPAEIWSGAAASEDRLKALTAPPRVLHLATHGFYLPGSAPEPMLLSGVALAGANRALAGEGGDGILFALEAQGLNLEGSELVVLSACDTAKGSLDYSEGVYGLVRAFRTAGVRNVLVTLWPLNDGEARDFIVAFYRTWLSQAGRSDPAQALRETRLTYLNNPNPALRDPRVWAPYVLIE